MYTVLHRIVMGRKKTRTNGAKKRNVYGEKAWSYAGICVLVLAIIMGMYYYRFTADTYLSRHTKVARRKERIQCHQTQRDRSFVKGCHVLDKACARIVRDNFISYDNVLQLRSIAELGMTARSRAGGPTIMDIDTGPFDTFPRTASHRFLRIRKGRRSLGEHIHSKSEFRIRRAILKSAI